MARRFFFPSSPAEVEAEESLVEKEKKKEKLHGNETRVRLEFTTKLDK